ncbi:VIN3-like protein 2 isoform X2 [Phalaenopsis equestris]|uniref:VIN3-like protein 2 isoform X2 n=1 Tax=Phalaenopsis equestris TaxID=78828 RepID=UPI0009E50D97|nr:VIN3-like protein 2 isoform X2 [Phalaenopsis equestris]
MESIFSGFVIDPAKCSELSLEEKRELVHEISRWADNAPEILQSWTRRELLQLICAEMGKERKYTGVTKPKMIEHLLRLVSQKNGMVSDDKNSISLISLKNKNGTKKKRKKEQPLQPGNDLHSDLSTEANEDNTNNHFCQNLVCRATLCPPDQYCKRCSCCICYQYDDNKDPSLWLVCSSDPPYCGDSCGMSCHLKCALKHEKAGILKTGYCQKLDGSFYCVYCGKINWLIGSWRKQLLIAKDARRVDVLCERLFLSHKILRGTEDYKELHSIVNAAVKKLKKEVGSLDKVSAVMARGIVNRLACGAEIQKLCAYALTTTDSILSSSFDLMAGAALNIPSPQVFCIRFEDLSPTTIIVSLHSIDEVFEENIIGCKLWHRCSKALDYPEEPTCIILRPEKRIMISGLCPSTEYFFRAAPFSSTKEFGRWESKCSTQNPSGNSGRVPDLNRVSSFPKKEHETAEQPIIIQTDSQKGSTNSSDDHLATKVHKHDSDNNESHVVPSNLEPCAFVSSNSVPAETPSKPNRVIGAPSSANKKESVERDYEYCVKVIRWLECEGHMEKEFRVKFLTWFSLKATQQERRVVSTFIHVLIDEPASLVAQLADAFMDGICSKQPAVQSGFFSRLWH